MYLWIKALHVFLVISWFAGVFYLPRLFVHHALSSDPATQERLAIMERKLFRFTLPIAFLAIISGIFLVSTNLAYYKSAAWLHAKITLVIILLGYHFYCGHLAKKFAIGENQRSHTFYRVFNEIPVLFLAAIVILVIVKPI